jgi:hypothetical protein
MGRKFCGESFFMKNIFGLGVLRKLHHALI